MADGRGGYRKPAGPRPPSGVGKASTRTDGNVQAVKVPNVGSSPDLQYGDRQKLEAAQRLAPIGKPPISRQPLPRGTTLRPDTLPPWMFEGDSNRPSEPGTAGMDMGPGPGSEALNTPSPDDDLRVSTLRYLSSTFGNEETYAMLHAMLQERAAMPPASGVPSPGTPPAIAPADIMGGEAPAAPPTSAPPAMSAPGQSSPLQQPQPTTETAGAPSPKVP